VARAGRAAAEYASRVYDVTPAVMVQAEDERRRVEHDLLNRKGHERIADLRGEMQKTMEESAGIYRAGASLAKGMEQLRGVARGASRPRDRDDSRTSTRASVGARARVHARHRRDLDRVGAETGGVARRAPAD